MRKVTSIQFYVLLYFIFSSLTIFSQPTTFYPKGMGGGGAVYSPSISPHNPNEAYLGCDMGQMFYTGNFGVSWRTLPNDTLTGHRHTKVNYTNHPDTMYVLRLDPVTSKTYPSISVNHGKNWTIIPSVSFWGAFGGLRLYANPKNSKQIIASNSTNIYFSNNWGNTFSSIHAASVQGSSFLHLAGVFYSDDTIFVSSDKGLILSPNGGASWSSFIPYISIGVASTEAVVSFGGAQRNGAPRLFATAISSANLSVKTEPRDVKYFQKVLRMDYTSGTPVWKDLTDSLRKADNQLNNFNSVYQVTLNSDNPDTVYFTGQTHSPATSNGAAFGTVFKTTDGGVTFKNVFLKNSNNTNVAITTGWVGGCNFIPAEHNWASINTTEGLCVDPNNINRLMRSDFSIVCTSIDGGLTWQQKYVSIGEHAAGTQISKSDTYQTNGLQSTVCHTLNWVDSNRILLTNSDILLWESNDAGQTWGYFYDSLAQSKVNDINMLARSTTGRWYAPTGETLGSNGDWSDSRLTMASGGKVMYSDNAVNWKTLKDFSNPVTWISFDPNNASVLYVSVVSAIAGSGGLFKCTGLPSNPTWTSINLPSRSEKRPTQIYALKNGDLVAVFGSRDSGAIAPTYTYTPSAGVFISSNGGNSWTDLCASYPELQKDLRFLVIDPNDTSQNVWFLGVGPNGNGTIPGLYRTVNRGAVWKKVWGGKSVVSCTFHPSNPSHMYISTLNDGLYYATNADTDSLIVVRVNAYPFRSPERIYFNPYNESETWVTSFGNGINVGYSPSYTINVSVIGSGSVSPGTQSATQGANKKFQFSPLGGFQLDSVWVDGIYVGKNLTYTFLNVQSNHSLKVSFTPILNTYIIQTYSGSNGQIFPAGAVPVLQGGSKKISVIPQTGYHVDSLLVDGIPVALDTSYTFQNVQSNHTIRAVFAIDKFIISASSGPGGTISPTGNIWVNFGDSARFYLIPDANFTLSSLTIDGAAIPVNSVYTFYNVKLAHTIVAAFSSTVSVSPVEHQLNNRIYPNPADEIVILNSTESSVVFTITVIQGKIISTPALCDQGSSYVRLNVQNLASGVYLVEIKSSTGISYQKLIISHTH